MQLLKRSTISILLSLLISTACYSKETKSKIKADTNSLSEKPSIIMILADDMGYL